MSDKTRNCPSCNAAMDFRLGQFDCPSCGHQELAAQPKQEAKSSGPGFQSQQQFGSSSGKPGNPPAVAPPPDTPGVSWGQPRQSGRPLEPNARYYPEGGFVDSLNTEKKIYFGIHLVAGVILILIVLFAATFAAQFAGTEMLFVVLALVFYEAIQLGIVWFVLFGSAIWSKWCCGGCAAIGVFGGLSAALGISSAAQASNGPGDAFIGALQIGMNIWLITILWRDIQQQNAY